jgi:magnesium transporter
MITYYFRTIKDEALATVDAPRPGVWVHAEAPTTDELERLTKEFGLDDSILKDAQDFFEVPRFERSSGGSYFFVRYPFDDATEDVDTAPMLIVMGESFVLTVAQRETPYLKPFFDGSVSIYTTQKAKFFLEIMRALTTAYEKELVRMRRAVHRDRVRLRSIRSRDIERLVQYEQTLNDMLSALIPTTAWLDQVSKGNYLQLFAEDMELYEDLMIANRQVESSAKSILKTIQNIRSAYEVLLSNTLNLTIRRLTALTILLTVPTAVTSLFGMNVTLPLSDHPYAFWLVLVFILALAGLIWHAFARNRWL